MATTPVHTRSTPLKAVGRSAGEGAGDCSLYLPETMASHGTMHSFSFTSVKKETVSASPSSKDYWKLKMPIQKEKGVRENVPSGGCYSL